MNCLFCDIASGKIEATKLFDDDDVVAFNDINPQAPTHILVIPKVHISTIHDVDDSHYRLLGKIIHVAKQISKGKGFEEDGYRLVFNVNQKGGQTVYHIHLHLLGGRQMTWPPG